MSRYYYSRDGSDIQGPISDTDLQGMRSAGLLNENTQICEEGTETWQPISFIKPPSTNSLLIQADRDPPGKKYVCPQCGSSNIQSVPLLYEAGTSTSISEGRVIGIAGLGTDHLTPAGGMTTTTHRQQTLLAARYSPPRHQTASNDNTVLLFIGVFALPVFVIVILAALFGNPESETPRPFFASVAIIAGILTGIAMLIPAIKALKAMRVKQKELTKVHEKQLSDWKQSFVCQKCGYFGRLH